MGRDLFLTGPPATARYIALQRTHLQPWTARLARRLAGRRMFEHLLDRLVAPRRTLAAYAAEMDAEYAALAPALPTKARKLATVG